MQLLLILTLLKKTYEHSCQCTRHNLNSKRTSNLKSLWESCASTQNRKVYQLKLFSTMFSMNFLNLLRVRSLERLHSKSYTGKRKISTQRSTLICRFYPSLTLKYLICSAYKAWKMRSQMRQRIKSFCKIYKVDFHYIKLLDWTI